MPADIPFVRELDVDYGRVDQVSPLIRRVIADNPSSFTAWGTGTYIIGEGNVAVVDPGPLDDAHLKALEAALEGETITHLLITHTHLDHSPLAAPMKEKHGAPTYAFGPHGAGKYEQGVVVEEGGDMDFMPDERVKHGDVIEGDGWDGPPPSFRRPTVTCGNMWRVSICCSIAMIACTGQPTAPR
jgi:glyoxylase-like metal-dependent hydrolase (beta-lactamase superfamily II)